jgi:hypothetical protein
VALFGAAANAQQSTAQRAPVPRQLLTARTAFVANGGSETYGADSYFDLTKYDGGPNRAYDAFYNALKDWGHYELVGSTTEADVLLVIRFTNPVVDRGNAASSGDVPHDWIRDPQLNLAINDPRSGLTLWSLTEHIEPAGGRADANRHFDEAITRLGADLRRLILSPEASLSPEIATVPPGAVDARQRRQRVQHTAIGVLLGSVAGAVMATRIGADPCNLDASNFRGCAARAGARARNEILTSVGAAIAGGVIGWLWPVS